MRKFLVDENLPGTLNLSTGVNEFHYIVDFGRQMTDSEIWNYAIENNYIIITKDTDFYEKIVLQGPPPKVIWIRLGNVRRKKFEKMITDMWGQIEKEIDNFDLIEVHHDRIEGLKIQ